MNPVTAPAAPPASRGLGKLAAFAVAMIALGAGGSYLLTGRQVAPPEPAKAAEKPETDSLQFPEEKWAAAGIRVEPAAAAPFTERVWRSGHLVLNETRVAHIAPMVEGIVREVKARLGQEVKAGDVLAVLDCREVGQAKLDLVRARLAARFASTQHDWTLATGRAGNELVEAMTGGSPVAEIEKQFRDRPIGDLRQQLTTAYSRRLQAKAQYEAAAPAEAQGAVSQSSLIRLRADYEAAEAGFRALCEEVKFQTGQQARASEQKLREAQTAESLAKATLMMLGYSASEVESMDPIAEGAAVSLYPVRAPFAGTIIEQHAVLAERVGPQHQMFQIADLTTLWLQADVPQKDLALARGLRGKVRFRAADVDGGEREADVFYGGDVVDKATRTVALSASVANADKALKPGMFVEVELTRPGGEALTVPESAVLRQGAQAFVFAHEGGDTFKRVDVKLGRASGGRVEILDGLQKGRPIATAGCFVLKSELLKDQMAGE